MPGIWQGLVQDHGLCKDTPVLFFTCCEGLRGPLWMNMGCGHRALGLSAADCSLMCCRSCLCHPVSLFWSPVAVTGAFCNISHFESLGIREICARVAAKACQGDPARGRFLGVKARQIRSLKKICFCRFALSSKMQILVQFLAALMPQLWVSSASWLPCGAGGHQFFKWGAWTSSVSSSWPLVEKPPALTCCIASPWQEPAPGWSLRTTGLGCHNYWTLSQRQARDLLNSFKVRRGCNSQFSFCRTQKDR